MKRTSRPNETSAWTHYWHRMPPANNGCLPGLPAPVAGHLRKIWADFFDSLPFKARLLDLGTGSGVVLILAKSHRPDIRLTGVDSAAFLPDLGDDIALHPGIRIEQLPFDDDSFDAITGQFAVEYANLAAAAREIKRLLNKGGRYHFVCHHAEGVIVRDNLVRLEALRGLLSPAGLLEAALKAVRQRKKSAPETRGRLARIFEATRRQYPDQSVVSEVGDDIAQAMMAADSLKKMLALRQDLEMEKKRLMALQGAALTEDKARRWACMLPREKEIVPLKTLRVPTIDLPFAWQMSNQANRNILSGVTPASP